MSEPASISSGIAARYATAIFELAREDKVLPTLEKDVDALDGALGESPDLSRMIASPLFTREQQSGVMAALASKMGLSGLVAHSLGVLSAKRRLFVLPQLITALREMIAVEKGEVTAEVTAATALSAAQSKALIAALKAQIGKDVKLKTAVDESLIGGLVVKVGSKMIDTSIRSKLEALQNAMKEVG
ncbi:ATP synthase subunit delta [mine drainage metagenome]|uniref:ATP synthase subunit delta n=1 Tax=mine drainage metagenome TaxID=410659 RepID=A0A1J5PVW9_9ZZZZ